MISLVCKDNGAELDLMLESFAQSDAALFPLCVLDNGSKERCWERIKRHVPTAQYIRLGESVKFPTALNILAQFDKDADWYGICHPDMRFPERWFIPLLVGLLDAPITCPRIWGRAHHSEPVPKPDEPFGEKEICANEAHASRKELAHPWLVRGEIFRKLGGFNEEYWPGFEDYDFLYRTHKLADHNPGYRVVEESLVYHYQSTTWFDPKELERTKALFYKDHGDEGWEYFARLHKEWGWSWYPKPTKEGA